MRSGEFEQQRRRPQPAAETGRSCWGRVLIFQSPAKGLQKNQQTQPVRPCTAGQAISPAGCCLVRGSQRLGMSTKKDAARPFGLGAFFRGGRYRTRTAAEATAACGGNREPRLGQRSDFSKPCQGAAEKSANATRTGASRQIPSRFPTPRNVYQERCRQTIRSGDFFRGGWYRTRTGTSKGRVSLW